MTDNATPPTDLGTTFGAALARAKGSARVTADIPAADPIVVAYEHQAGIDERLAAITERRTTQDPNVVDLAAHRWVKYFQPDPSPEDPEAA